MPSATWDLKKIIGLMIEAGQYALSHRHALSVTEKPDKTIVTQIDVAIEKFFQKESRVIAPSSYFIGEESIKEQDDAYIRRAFEGDCWIVDPIDGTVPFTFGLSMWGISVAHMRGGVIREGCLLLPVYGIALATAGAEIYKIELGYDPLQWAVPNTLDPFTYAPPAADYGIISLSQDMARYGTLNTTLPVQSVGSCVYSVVQYLLGAYCGVITHVKLWDIAAGLALLHNSKSIIKTDDGALLDVDTLHNSFLIHETGNAQWGMRSHIHIAPTAPRCDALRNTVRNITY